MSHANTMTLHVIHDRAGRILAAAAVPDSATDRHDVATPLPFALAGQRSARISMPHMDASQLSALLERHRVSGTADRAKLVAAQPARPRKPIASTRKK